MNITEEKNEPRRRDLRSAVILIYVTLGWMLIEGSASLCLGLSSKSLLLEGFSGTVLLWRLRVELNNQANEKMIERTEQQAGRLVGISLYLLAIYIAAMSAYELLCSQQNTNTHESVWGILIGVVAKVGMPLLANLKFKFAAKLKSHALHADAVESITCGYLSIVLIVGLAATRILGWWWLDSIAALALIPFLIKEGREAITGECTSSCEEKCHKS
jgi:Co/Zn/Cd efflux system component